MQEKSDITQNFLDRFEKLTVRIGQSTAAACKTVGISRSLFYEIRDGKREPTLKMLERLRQAEASAIADEAGSVESGNAKSSGEVNELPVARENISQVNDGPAGTVTEALLRLARANEQIAKHLQASCAAIVDLAILTNSDPPPAQDPPGCGMIDRVTGTTYPYKKKGPKR
jgi:hypothetical protein